MKNHKSVQDAYEMGEKAVLRPFHIVFLSIARHYTASVLIGDSNSTES